MFKYETLFVITNARAASHYNKNPGAAFHYNDFWYYLDEIAGIESFG